LLGRAPWPGVSPPHRRYLRISRFTKTAETCRAPLTAARRLIGTRNERRWIPSLGHEPDADRALKAKHRALWASGDYPAVAAELIPTLDPKLVQACGVRSGDRVLDVAAGSGNAAIPAAETGAIVIASDLTPELFDAGRRIAAFHGVELEWVEADAKRCPSQATASTGDVVRGCDVRAAPPATADDSSGSASPEEPSG